MRDNRTKILQEILEESLLEKKKTDDELKKNLNRIKEIDSFLDSIKNGEEADFKIFSPRTAESIHREKIEEVTEERKLLENSNDSYYKDLGKIESRIEKISFLIENRDVNKRLSILNIQEKERSRIARELHDSSLQNLAHLVHSIELGTLFIDQDPIRAKLELASCSENLKQVINEIRDTVFNLRPMSFDDLGFKQCIENLVDNLKKQYKNFTFFYDVDDVSEKYKKSENKDTFNLLLVTIYRVIQEAMINAVKHSGGNKLELTVKDENNELVVKVIDNGKGFSLEESDDKHFGISIMRERILLLGGQFEITSKPEQGTRVYITVPLL